MNTATMDHFPIFELADELIIAIVQHVESRSDLCALAQTCRRLCKMAEPLIYRNIFIRTESQARAILQAITPKRHRACAVVTFEARCKYGEFTNVELCSDITGLTPNLREYVLESPFCNSKRWKKNKCINQWPRAFDCLMCDFREAAARAEHAPLQNLTKRKSV